MPRSRRSDFAGQIYHALNRGNARNDLFFKDGDYEAFERVIKLGLEKYPVDLIAYQIRKRCQGPFWYAAGKTRINKRCQGPFW